jgi:MFS family permease
VAAFAANRGRPVLKILASLSALILAVSLVVLANATMMTVLPLRMLQGGAGDTAVALLGAAYSLGFLVGCFSEPPRILRVGYIRAFAAAAAICTTLAIVTDFTASDWLWIVLRFLTGVAVASIFASVDGWINAASPDALRGRVVSAYAWCTGAAQVLGQLLLVRVDGLEVGFVTLLAIGFNVAVVLVTLTRTAAPAARPEPTAASSAPAPQERGPIVVTSWTGALAALLSGLVVTTVASILPGVLAGVRVGEAGVALAIASFYLGRLVLQMPIGALADRMDKRLLIGILSALIAVTTGLGSVFVLGDLAGMEPGTGQAARALFLGIVALVGGLSMPLFAVGNSLAFARGAGAPPVKIATTLLLFWSAGSVAGPVLVAATAPAFGSYAMSWVIVGASAGLAAFALVRRVTMAPAPKPSSATLNDVPASSLALAETVAAIEAAAAAPAGAARPAAGVR